MKPEASFNEILGKYVSRSRYSYGQLADLSGIPKRTIANWMAGKVSKPHSWEDIAKIATVLHLDEEKASRLLRSAGHPSIAELLANSLNTFERELLSQWVTDTIFPALHQLESPPGDFTGRETELETMIHVARGNTHIFGIFGVGGIGKTALALKFADAVKNHFPDAQIYMDLQGTSESPMTAGEIIYHFFRSLKVDFTLPENEKELIAAYRSILEGKRAIVFLDNVESARQATTFIPPENCLLMVTSRQYFHLPGMHPVILENLPPVEAETFLTRIAPRIDGFAGEISRLCDYMPLALRLAGCALVAWRNLDVHEYVEWLRDEKKRLHFLDSALALSHESRGVEASFELSFRLLDPANQHQWALLSVFSETFDSEAASAIWDVPLMETKQTLSNLVSKNLVNWNPTHHRYKLHDLVKLFADSRLPDAEKFEGRKRHAQYYGDILQKAERLYDLGGDELSAGLQLFDLEWKNIQASLSFMEAHVKDINIAKLYDAFFSSGLRLTTLRLHPSERLHWLLIALESAYTLNRRDKIAAYCKNLGIACYQLGQYDQAISYHEEAIQSFKELDDPLNEGRALGNLGLVYMRMGYHQKALAHFEAHLKKARLSGDRVGESNALGNLGIVCKNLVHFTEAESYHLQALAIARELGDKEGEGESLNDLGTVYAESGKFDLAIETYRQSLEITEALGDIRTKSSAISNIGYVYLKSGNPKAAVDYFKQALEIDEETGDQQSKSITLCELGEAYLELGDSELDNALQNARAALAIALEIGDIREQGDAKWVEAQVYWRRGFSEQAISTAQVALKLLEEIEDPRYGEIGKTLSEWVEGQ